MRKRGPLFAHAAFHGLHQMMNHAVHAGGASSSDGLLGGKCIARRGRACFWAAHARHKYACRSLPAAAAVCGACMQLVPCLHLAAVQHWCGPCKLVLPSVEWAAKEFEGQVKVVKVEADSNKDLVEKFKVGPMR